MVVGYFTACWVKPQHKAILKYCYVSQHEFRIRWVQFASLSLSKFFQLETFLNAVRLVRAIYLFIILLMLAFVQYRQPGL